MKSLTYANRHAGRDWDGRDSRSGAGDHDDGADRRRPASGGIGTILATINIYGDAIGAGILDLHLWEEEAKEEGEANPSA